MLALFIAALFVSYCFLVIVLIIGWKLVEPGIRPDAIGNHVAVEVSVVVAARNEAPRIRHLINDLRNQQFANFEVIIIDDHSEDGTTDVCVAAVAGDGRFKVVQARGIGKKAALTQAIELARGTIILTTDADCRIGPFWVRTMCAMLAQPSVMFCFGCVAISSSNLFGKMQALEFAALVGSSAATAALGAPTMCNGANLAYRKRAFEGVNGYVGNEAIASGDDEFLMRKILKAFPGSVCCCTNRDALVRTSAAVNAMEFIRQRLRWAGKWKSNSSLISRLLAVYVFCFHGAVVLLPVLVAMGIVPVVGLYCLLFKAFAELYLFILWRPIMSISRSWSAFLLLQLIHSPYVVFVAITSQFVSFEWKGRRINGLAISDR